LLIKNCHPTVGAGSSGAVVANRLVKNNFKVLLLEAGGEQQPGQYIPANSLILLNKPQTDWSHYTVPQTKACLASVNQVRTLLMLKFKFS